MNLTVETIAPHKPRDLRAFADIEAWVFDLDNTLYPRSSNLFRQVDERIRMYVRKLLNVDEAEADRIQKTFYREHGTTLRGLMLKHSVDPDDFLAFVHDIDHSVVKADPALGAAILGCQAKNTFLPTARAATPRRSRRGSAFPRISPTFSTSSTPISCRSRSARPTTDSSTVLASSRSVVSCSKTSRAI